MMVDGYREGKGAAGMSSSEGLQPAKRDRRGSVVAPNRPADFSRSLQTAAGVYSGERFQPGVECRGSPAAGHNLQLRMSAKFRPTQCNAAELER
jgi:hypothetical protein